MHWWGVYNRELFQGCLTRPLITYGESGIEFPVYGFFCPEKPRGRLHIDSRVVDKKEARAVLLHEMIHQEQWALGKKLTHGRYFKQRARELSASTGLNVE